MRGHPAVRLEITKINNTVQEQPIGEDEPSPVTCLWKGAKEMKSLKLPQKVAGCRPNRRAGAATPECFQKVFLHMSMSSVVHDRSRVIPTRMFFVHNGLPS